MEIILIIFLTFCSVLALMQSSQTQFDNAPVNVTVKAGETAILPCSVDKLGKNNTVIWMNPYSILISNEDRRIIDNTRMSVERPYTKDWNLHIREVRYGDKGQYTCQVNTNPVKIKRVFLDIKVPSTINEEISSRDMRIREGETVDIICNVTGVPQPSVMWFRTTKYEPQTDEHMENRGEVLSLKNISRFDDGTYRCLAYNGVPPAVTRDIKIEVQFPPEIRLRNKRLGQSLGRETILECLVTAEPQAQFEWLRDGIEMPTKTWKYRIEVFRETLDTVTLSLRIRTIDEGDYGIYTCVASNILGSDQQQMELYEYKIVTIKPPMSTLLIGGDKHKNSVQAQGSDEISMSGSDDNRVNIINIGDSDRGKHSRNHLLKEGRPSMDPQSKLTGSVENKRNGELFYYNNVNTPRSITIHCLLSLTIFVVFTR